MGFKIDKIQVDSNVVLAPMAGVSNASFRLISRNLGAGVVFAEMVSDKGLTHDNEKTKDLLASVPGEHPYAQQIFGSDIETMVEAAKYVDQHTDCDIIDINMGCPVPKVAQRAQAGAALLKDPDKVYDIIKAIKANVSKPVTVKIRAGWDHTCINAVEIARKAEAAGASAITIHGRTRSQMYTGLADLEVIKAVKAAVKIPVIGNGDIKDGPSAKRMLDYTGVDAVMVGRAALGNPWIFYEINHYLQTGEEAPRPSLTEIKQMILEHGKSLMDLKGEHLAMLQMRGQGTWYFKGLHNAKETKDKLSKVKTWSEFVEIINTYFDQEIENPKEMTLI
ncbi:tRNA dihydrouridine synthase DusB [Paracholeplasma manati]|uniref:tRNA dihydrouridine synthase DusB n=1 Tax=Paracholeplasma manati TaxID=591373 RepID=UPI0024087165|nr:tRNA dihydrouridine synthase DusB [Paracholeplasma manati]MDG0888482.1 tRNA dihydrouridine synthase DusB [Paracholeplasma manati]